ncbi:MAG TPA: hypothetical protein VME67_15155, partial [Mycobacterium sp.]
MDERRLIEIETSFQFKFPGWSTPSTTARQSRRCHHHAAGLAGALSQREFASHVSGVARNQGTKVALKSVADDGMQVMTAFLPRTAVVTQPPTDTEPDARAGFRNRNTAPLRHVSSASWSG